jgi:hypothetical protein
MNWDAIGAIAELLGALGVLGSLLYLAVQIRQNTKALRGIAIDAVTSHQRDELRWFGEPGCKNGGEEQYRIRFSVKSIRTR